MFLRAKFQGARTPKFFPPEIFLNSPYASPVYPATRGGGWRLLRGCIFAGLRRAHLWYNGVACEGVRGCDIIVNSRSLFYPKPPEVENLPSTPPCGQKRCGSWQSHRAVFMYKKAAFRLEKLCNSGSFMDRLDKLPRINF